MFLFQNLVLVAMVFVIFWVTFFPLISEALTGTKVSVGPPAFRPFIVPLALILVLLSGIGPIIAWRRVTVANLRRNFTFPAAVARGDAGRAAGASGADSRPFALVMFVLGAFVLASVVQELVARRRRPAGHHARARRRSRSAAWCAATAAATAATSCTAGWPCCSSAWPPRRRSRTPATRTSSPGQTATVGGYQFRYVRPTAAVEPAEAVLRRRPRRSLSTATT